MAEKKAYDSTVARIAGNLLSGRDFNSPTLIQQAVAAARAIVAETKRTEPESEGR